MIMGWAKYAEDNYEIILERQRGIEERQIIEGAFSNRTSLQPQAISVSYRMTCDNKSTYCSPKKNDVYLCCKDCGRVFTFTADAQQFFELKGWVAPKRCKVCRNHKKALAAKVSLY